MNSFGNCMKHPNFPMVNCPQCEIDNKVDELDIRISSGEEIIIQCNKQLKNLKNKKREIERLKFMLKQNL